MRGAKAAARHDSHPTRVSAASSNLLNRGEASSTKELAFAQMESQRRYMAGTC